MRRVLLTGATGFIGRQTASALLTRGFEVHAVTSRQSGPLDDRLIWHRANLLERSEQRGVIEDVRPTYLLHLAWVVEPGAYWTSLENLRWIGSSLELLRSFVEAGGSRVMIAGTCAEYRWGDQDLSEDDTPIEPVTLYGVAKDALHRVAACFTAQEKVDLAWGRVFFLYGPHEPSSRLVSSVAAALLRGEIARCTSGASLRDYLHVSDVGDAFAAILDSSVTGAVNIGSGEAIPVRRIIEQIGAECGRPDLVAFGGLPDRHDEPARICADVRRLRSEVGWTPRLSLEQGLRSTVDWWRALLRRGAHVGA